MEHGSRVKDTIENFFLKYKLLLIVLALVVLVLGIALPLLLNSINKRAVEAIRKVEALEEAYEEFIASYSFYRTHDEITEETLQELVSGYEQVVEEHPRSMAAQKASINLATVYSITEDFEKAATYYEMAAGMNKTSHLRPRALFNLGSVYENLGRDEEAITVYQQVVDEHSKSMEAAHAMFNIARLNEKISGDIQQALGFYTLLINNKDWEQSPFVNIAKSRLALIDKLPAPDAENNDSESE